MKKIIATLLLLATAVISLAACQKRDDTQIKVAYMQGPTGMGMAKLISDFGGEAATEKYDFTKYTDASKVNEHLMSGAVDIACLPTNNAAKFYNTINPDIQVLAVNCLNSLYILTNNNVTVNSINDLNGKTIYTCKAGTPKIILEKLLEAYGIDCTISYSLADANGNVADIATPQDLPAVILGNKADIILAPEPMVSTALSKPAAKHTVALDVGKLWDAKFDTPIAMGCIVARTDFIKEHPVAVELFLDAYEDSIDYMSDRKNLDNAAKLVVDAGIMADAAIAKSALINLDDALEYEDGDDMKEILNKIYTVFGNSEIGGKLPNNGFYYEEEDD